MKTTSEESYHQEDTSTMELIDYSTMYDPHEVQMLKYIQKTAQCQKQEIEPSRHPNREKSPNQKINTAIQDLLTLTLKTQLRKC